MVKNGPSFHIYLMFKLMVNNMGTEVLKSIIHLIQNGSIGRRPVSSFTLVFWNPPSFHIPCQEGGL